MISSYYFSILVEVRFYKTDQIKNCRRADNNKQSNWMHNECEQILNGLNKDFNISDSGSLMVTNA